MKHDPTTGELVALAKQDGIVLTLYRVFGKCVKVRIPFSQKAYDTGIDSLDFSVRANNAMKRVGVFTVGQVIELIAGDRLMQIRNLGKKTQNEIKTHILAFGYDRLTEKEQNRFFADVIEANASS